MREINLLPPSRRQSLRREVTLASIGRFLSSLMVGLGMLTVGAVLAMIGLWIFFYTVAATNNVEFERTIAQYRELRDGIAEQNIFLNYIYGLGTGRQVWSDFLPGLFTSIPPGVEIATMSGRSVINEEGVVESTFTVSGRAAARSTLTIFADRLRLLPDVAQVDAPSSNLIQRENPLYRFTLQLKDKIIEEEEL
ncbi:MAG: hypothetical protein WEA04_04860 [Candidatus Andersenbacteria bacterium]